MNLFSRWVLALSSAVILAMAGICASACEIQHQSLRQDVAANLEAIAQLKAGQIIQWRNERLPQPVQKGA